MTTLEAALAAGSMRSVALAKQMGEPGRAFALDALVSPSARTREAGIRALAAIGNPGDLAAIGPLVADEEFAVAAAATEALRRGHVRLPGQGGILARAFDAAEDPGMRAELALAMGERTDVPVDALRERLRAEEDKSVKRALTVALAKRGAPAELRIVAFELARAKGRERAACFARAEYLGGSAAVPMLVARLDDESLIDPDLVPAIGARERACDRAARLVCNILGANVSFAARGFSGLSKAERDEVRAAAREAGAAPAGAGTSKA